MKKKSEQEKTPDFSCTKIYKSLFVLDLDIDVSNYITEIIISRYWEFKNKIPPVPFWQKEYKDNYKKLTDSYVYELTQVKKLLKVFSPAVVLYYIKNNNITTLRYAKLEDTKEIIFGLFKNQLIFINQIKEISKNELEKENDKIEYIENKTRKKDNLFSKGV
jgi:hypothetical protein